MMSKYTKFPKNYQNFLNLTKYRISFLSKRKQINDMPFYHLKIIGKSPYNKWGLYLIAEQKSQMNFSHPIFNIKYSTCFFICGLLLFSTPSIQGIFFVFYFLCLIKLLRIFELRKINKKTIQKIYLIKNRKNEIAVQFLDSKKLLTMRINYISITNDQIFEQVDLFNNNMPITYLDKTLFIPTNIKVYDRQAFDSVMNGIVPYFVEESESNAKKTRYQKLQTYDYLSYKI